MMKRYIAGVLAAAAGCVMLLSTIHTEILQQKIAGKILRFHVLANSDSGQDQALKLKVRDAVGSFLAEPLAQADSMADSERIVEEQIPEIERVAGQVVAEEGYAYRVDASLEQCAFPEKSYGAYTFPAGEYQALRVVIGEGKGHNWWCVMYPNLCFSGSMYEVDEQSGEKLQAELTGEEYAAVIRSGDYQVQFGILKFLNRVLE